MQSLLLCAHDKVLYGLAPYHYEVKKQALGHSGTYAENAFTGK